MAEPNESATFETRKDAGEGAKGVWRLWMTALDLAGKTEEDWRKSAEETQERYRDEKRTSVASRKGGRFNILYSTMQTLAPSIYNSTPRPDVRRRFNDRDPVGKVAAQVFERGLSHCVDEYDFDDVMGSTVHDSLLRGRGVAIVVYAPVEDEGEVQYETTLTEHVQWDDFRHGPAKKWVDVPWAAIRYRITREEAVDLNSKIGATVSLDHTEKGADKDSKDVPDVFKRLVIWKIWDKVKKKIVFIAPSYREGPFAVEDDILNLQGFFPFPRPMHDIPDPSNLIPLVPYSMYRDQAEELDRVSARIKILVNCLKWRGIRPSQITELDNLAGAEDGDLIPSESAAAVLQMAQTGGDMNKAIWLMPIDKLIAVIRELVIHRETIKQVIFEITGIADILRGTTDPNETLGAQQLKAQFGSLRMQSRQREVQRFARDLMRIKAEIIGEQYSIETLQLVSGIELPTPQQKFQAQQVAVQGQATGQPPPEQVQQILAAPTWEEVKAVMASDVLRSFRVDIETDSTILADLGQAQQNMSGFVEGLSAFLEATGPAVQAGFMPVDIVTDLLTGFARNFKLGKQAEDALERLGQQVRKPQQDKPDPEAIKARAEAQRHQEDMTLKREEMQAKAQERAAAAQKAEQAQVLDLRTRQEDMALRREELEFSRQERAIQQAVRDTERDEKRIDHRTEQEFKQRQFDSSEAGNARESLTDEIDGIQQTVQQALEVATEAIRQLTELRKDLAKPKKIDVQRKNGRITGGVVSQGGIDTEIVLN